MRIETDMQIDLGVDSGDMKEGGLVAHHEQ